MRTPRALLLLAACAAAGGCRTFVYSGAIEARDSSNQERKYVIYWARTDRLLWFDSAAGSVTVLGECSADALQFDERPEGLVFRKRPNDVRVPATAHGADEATCGRILDAKSVRDLAEGPLELSLYCRPQSDEFAAPGATAYLHAEFKPYTFPITRARTRDLAKDTPKRPPCRTRNP